MQIYILRGTTYSNWNVFYVIVTSLFSIDQIKPFPRRRRQILQGSTAAKHTTTVQKFYTAPSAITSTTKTTKATTTSSTKRPNNTTSDTATKPSEESKHYNQFIIYLIYNLTIVYLIHFISSHLFF